MKPAVFLDRDGTVIEQIHYLRDPADVALVPGAAEAIARLRERGYLCVVVTNQSAIGRGMLDEPGLADVHTEMTRQLEAAGACVDAIYFCPVVPQQKDPTRVEYTDRKPGPGMLLRAAQDHDLDLASSWMVGDHVSDVLAGRNAGCRASILVRTGHGERFAERRDCYDHIVDNVLDAARLVVSTDHGGMACGF